MPAFVGCLLTLAASSPAHAQIFSQGSAPQGFLQGWFGSPQPPGPQPLGQSAPYQSQPPVSAPVPHASPAGRIAGPSNSGQSNAGQSRLPRPAPSIPSAKTDRPQSRSAAGTLGGGLRTMCVRLCDGYYWPMTFNANRSRLDHDAKVCTSACSSEARLFTMPDSGEAKDMVDRQGRAYVKLPTAFAYRKPTANLCSCRPDPWEGEARARHETLASAAKAAGSAELEPQRSGQVTAPAAASMPSFASLTPAGPWPPTAPLPPIAPMTLAAAETLSLAGASPDRATAAVPVADASSDGKPAKVAAVASDAAPGSTPGSVPAKPDGGKDAGKSESAEGERRPDQKVANGKPAGTRPRNQPQRAPVVLAHYPAYGPAAYPGPGRQAYPPPTGLGRSPSITTQPQGYRSY